MNLPRQIVLATIGTGTAGRHSNLAQGIVNGLRQAQPDACLLCHSSSPDSQTIAELVADDLAPIRCDIRSTFPDPDDLAGCRTAVRAAIRELRQRFAGHHLVLNPTSGTKQMTAGAVLAGIDERVNAIQYIAGDRVDGVVKTGTERLVNIDTRRILAGETGRNALALLNAGAWHSACIIVAPYKELLPQTHAAAGTFDAWDRFDYRGALQLCTGNVPDSSFWKAVRKALATLAEVPELSLQRTADAFNFCARALAFGRPDEALAASYRLVEWFARLRLKEFGIPDDAASADSFLGHPELNCCKSTRDQLVALEKNSRKNSSLRPGLALMLTLLEGTGFSFSDAFARRSELRALLQSRQDTRYGHGACFVDKGDAERLLQTIRTCANEQWPDFHNHCTSYAFPEHTPIVKEEIDHV